MFKRGQISIFFVMIIVILVIFGFFSYLNIKEEVDEEVISTDLTSSFTNYVENCIEDTGEDALYFVTLQGGYYNSPELSRPYFNIKLPYYWYEGKKYKPTKETIEQELSQYINENLQPCLSNFTTFKDIGYSIQTGLISTETTITEQNIVHNVNYPITLSKGSLSKNIDKFIGKVDVNFNRILDVAEQIMQEQEKNPNYVSLGFISTLAYNNNFTFETINLEDDEVIHSLIFERPLDKPIIYGFVNKYDWSEY